MKTGRKTYYPTPPGSKPPKRYVEPVRARWQANERRARKERDALRKIPRTYDPQYLPKTRPSKTKRSGIWLPDRPKGSKPFQQNVIVQGVRTTQTTIGSDVSQSYQLVTAYQKIKGPFVSQNGDHRHPNPHNYSYVEIDYGSGVSWSGLPTNNTVISGTQPIAMNLSHTYPSLLATAYNSAVGDLYTQIRGDVDLSIDLIQVGQARKMIRDTLKGMSNLLVTFKKMRRSNPRDWGNLWLEFTYGWRPLANSIFGTLEKAITNNAGLVSYINAKGKERYYAEAIEVTPVNGGRNIRTQYAKARYSVRLRCLYNVQNSRLNQLAGYTSLNPISIAWEVIPYSFVVDWFVDIGGYIRNYENALLYGSSFVDGYVDNLVVQDLLEYHDQRYNAGSLGSGYANAKGGRKSLVFSRSIVAFTPKSLPPDWAPHLGTSRLFSAAALLGQFLPSLGPSRRYR